VHGVTPAEVDGAGGRTRGEPGAERVEAVSLDAVVPFLAEAGGSARSVEEFVRDAWPSLYRTALLVTGSPHDAEDAVQNAMAVVVEHWDRISRGESPTGYSRRVIATQAYRKARRRRLELDRLLLLRRSYRDADDDGSERTVQRDALLSALQQLPPRMRTAVVMRFYCDLSERETAEALGCSTGTVKSQTHKGLARLRAAIGPTWDDDAGQPVGGTR